jgi:hypothetical protein
MFVMPAPWRFYFLLPTQTHYFSIATGSPIYSRRQLFQRRIFAHVYFNNQPKTGALVYDKNHHN